MVPESIHRLRGVLVLPDHQAMQTSLGWTRLLLSSLVVE
jgi:hypothetical protein